jgi:CRISPR type III-A-associated RAMP protein Csm4
MSSAFIVRFRPSGPWRFGNAAGARDKTDSIGHSDTLHAALHWAIKRLGRGEEFAAAQAAEAGPAVRVSSLYPFGGRTLYIAPPKSHWPPEASARVRWKAARLVPLSVVEDLLSGKALAEDRWEVEPRSGCLVSSGAAAPFRIAQRRAAGVDRAIPGRIEPHRTACLEFGPNAGLWCAVVLESSEWEATVKAAFRLLADSGLGGERSIGWGQADAVEFGAFPGNLTPAAGQQTGRHWLWSLYHPAATDQVDWTQGHYAALMRGSHGSKAIQMLEEGSVLSAQGAPQGRLVDLGDAETPQLRSGFAVSVTLPEEVMA